MTEGNIWLNEYRQRSLMPSRRAVVYCHNIVTICMYCHQKWKFTSFSILLTKSWWSLLNLSWYRYHMNYKSSVCHQQQPSCKMQMLSWQSSSASATYKMMVGSGIDATNLATSALLYAIPAITACPCRPLSTHTSASPELFICLSKIHGYMKAT